MSENTINLWTLGDQNVTEYKNISLSDSLPAGDYNVSLVVASTDTDSEVSRIYFYKNNSFDSSNINLYRDFTRNSRNSVTFSTSDPITGIRLTSSTNVSSSSGDTSTWSNIMIKSGFGNSSYIPPVIATDYSARNDITSLKNDIAILEDESLAPVEFTIIPNTYPKSDGTIGTESAWDRTDYIPVSEGEIYYFYNTYNTSNDNAFYNANKQIVSTFSILKGSPYAIRIPSGVHYMIVSQKAMYFYDIKKRCKIELFLYQYFEKY